MPSRERLLFEAGLHLALTQLGHSREAFKLRCPWTRSALFALVDGLA
jgi:hypothetical protein